MESLYGAMESLLEAEESVNSLWQILDTSSNCRNEEKEKTALALINVTCSVLKEVVGKQHRAVEIIDIFLADYAKHNR